MAGRGEQSSGSEAGQEPEHNPEQKPGGGTSRRAFLTAGGIAAAGVIAGGVAGGVIGHERGVNDASAGAGRRPAHCQTRGAAPGIEHIVVLMGENRSFDNLLGFLYTPDDLPTGQTFDGLAFGDYSNTRPRTARTVAAHVYAGTDRRDHEPPDPGPRRGVPARQHAALRHRRPAVERRNRRRGDAGAVQRAGGPARSRR